VAGCYEGALIIERGYYYAEQVNVEIAAKLYCKRDFGLCLYFLNKVQCAFNFTKNPVYLLYCCSVFKGGVYVENNKGNKISNTDRSILEILEQDCRVEPREIATLLNFAESEVKQRIAEMEQRGIINKYQAMINWDKAGDEKVNALIEVKITPQREVGFDAVAERIYRFPEVHSVMLMSGAYDLAVFLEGKTMKDVAQFVSSKLATMEHVLSTATHFVLKTYKKHGCIMEDQETDRRLVVTP